MASPVPAALKWIFRAVPFIAPVQSTGPGFEITGAFLMSGRTESQSTPWITDDGPSLFGGSTPWGRTDIEPGR